MLPEIMKKSFNKYSDAFSGDVEVSWDFASLTKIWRGDVI